MLKSKWFTTQNIHITPIKQQWLQIKFFFVLMVSLHFIFNKIFRKKHKTSTYFLTIKLQYYSA